MGDFHELAIRIKALRSTLNLTQRQFAEKVGCTAATLSAYENGSKSPSLEIVKNIAVKCNVSIDWLVGLIDHDTNQSEIETYSDIIEMLFKIDEAMRKRNLALKIYTKETELGYGISYLAFSEAGLDPESNFNQFLNEWARMRKLYETLVIDIDVYELWQEKTLDIYNVELCDLADEHTANFYDHQEFSRNRTKNKRKK